VQAQPPSDCCEKLIAAIAAMQSAIAGAIAGAAAELGSTPAVDLSGITAALNQLVAAANAEPATALSVAAILCKCLDEIAAKIPPATDVSGIVTELKKLNVSRDIPEAILSTLRSKMNLPADINALLQGESIDYYNAILDMLGFFVPGGEYDRWLKGETTPHSPTLDRATSFFRNWLSDLAKSYAPLVTQLPPLLLKGLSAVANAIISAEDFTFAPIVKNLIEQITPLLKPAGGAPTSLGNINVDPDGPIGVATGVAFTANVLSFVASFAGWDVGESATKFADIFAGAVGWEELKDVLVGPLVRHGIAAVADMNARALFRQHIPRGNDVAEWMARGLVTQAFGQRLMNLDGFGDEIQPPTIAAAQVGINPRQLLRMLPAGLLQTADLTDELTFAGMRQASQSRFQLFAPYMASERERGELRTSLQDAYVAGLLADADYTGLLDSAEQDLARDDLALRAAKWKKLVAITRDLENEYSTLYLAGLLDDATYRSNLAGIGLQADRLDAVAAKSEARAEATLQRNTIRAAAALARKTADVERRAAVKGITTGTIPAAAGAAALIATGLTPIQAAAWTGLAELAQIGNLRFVYGLPLNATDAALLRGRVTALVTQYEAALITEAALNTGLAALKIPQVWINAIRAGAVRKVTPATGATAVALSTQ
jgi:hypothetical protein